MVINRYITVIAIGFVILPSVLAFAHGGATGIVKERMDMMGEIAGAMKTIGKMIKGEAAYDRDVAKLAALQLKKHADHIPEMFPKGSTKKPSEALPAIWSNWDEFVNVSMKMSVEAENLATLASTAGGASDIGAQFAKVGKTCASCHEKFRLKK